MLVFLCLSFALGYLPRSGSCELNVNSYVCASVYFYTVALSCQDVCFPVPLKHGFYLPRPFDLKRVAREVNLLRPDDPSQEWSTQS